MAWSKPFDDVEAEYVRNHYPKMGCAALAAKLGRSERGVRNLVKRLGLAEPCAPAGARSKHDARASVTPALEEDCERQDELAELREMKKVLKHTMHDDIDPRALPKVTAELREVIRRISELEEGGSDGGSGALAGSSGSLVVSVPLRPA